MSLTITRNPNAHASAIRQFTWELTWSPEKFYPPASMIEIRSGCLRCFHLWGFVDAEVERGDIEFRWKINPRVGDGRENPNYVLVRAKLPYGAQRGEPLKIRLTCIPSMWANLPQQVSIWTRDPQPILGTEPDAPEPLTEAEAGSSVELIAGAGPIELVRLYATPSARANGMVRLVVSPEDRYGNRGRFAQAVNATLSWDGSEQSLSLQDGSILSLPATAVVSRATLTLKLEDLALAENISNGAIEGDCVTVTSNPVWPVEVDGLMPAYGEFHWHTEHSGDGQQSVAGALAGAHDLLNMDWATPTDHDTTGDDWKRSVEAVEAAYRPGEFATLFGWESSTHLGHENYYFTDPDHPLVCGGSIGYRGGIPRDTAAIIREHRDVIVVPHHTNAVSETRRMEDDAPYWHQYDWSVPTPNHRLTEIFQIRGNQERNDYPDAWRGWHQRNGSSVQDALARGYRLGFTGGTDNHHGNPGRAHAAYEGGSAHPQTSQILTGVWLPKLERQPLYDSLHARHTWAVWDTRAIMRFTINGALMGDDLIVTEGDALSAGIKASAEAPWQSVELVSEGETIWSAAFHTLDIDTTIDLGAATRSTHVYLRALLRNGGLVYASPVFIDLKRG